MWQTLLKSTSAEGEEGVIPSPTHHLLLHPGIQTSSLSYWPPSVPHTGPLEKTSFLCLDFPVVSSHWVCLLSLFDTQYAISTHTTSHHQYSLLIWKQRWMSVQYLRPSHWHRSRRCSTIVSSEKINSCAFKETNEVASGFTMHAHVEKRVESHCTMFLRGTNVWVTFSLHFFLFPTSGELSKIVYQLQKPSSDCFLLCYFSFVMPWLCFD